MESILLAISLVFVWIISIVCCVGLTVIWLKVRHIDNIENSLANMEQYLRALSEEVVRETQDMQSKGIISFRMFGPSVNDYMQMAIDAGVDVNNKDELKKFFDDLNNPQSDEDTDKPWEKNT